MPNPPECRYSFKRLPKEKNTAREKKKKLKSAIAFTRNYGVSSTVKPDPLFGFFLNFFRTLAKF
jgi:hypothetical protein